MKKYAKIINEETKACEVGIGTNAKFYQSIGMTEMEVEQAYNGGWYLEGYAPEKPEPTKEEIKDLRAQAYAQEVDCITAHIQRLRDENPLPEEEINLLIEERNAKVEEIKERYPYPIDNKEDESYTEEVLTL